MNEIKMLTALELRSLYGINKFLHMKDKKAKNRYKLLLVAWSIIIAVVCGYIGGIVYGLSRLSLSYMTPIFLITVTSLIIMLFGMFKAGHLLLSDRGYDILASMPIRSSSIIIGRFISMYVEDLIISLVIMLPGVVVYGVLNNPNPLFYITTLIGLVFIPAIPLVLSTLLGTLIIAISSRTKHKSIIQAVLMVAVIVPIFLLSFNLEGMQGSLKEEKIREMVLGFGNTIEKIYYPGELLSKAILNTDIVRLLIFIVLSLIFIVLTVTIIGKRFHEIIRRLHTFKAKHNYKLGELERSSLTKAMYKRELKRYLSSGIYVTNTIIGPIMGFIMSIALLIVGVEEIEGQIPIDIDVRGVIPFVLAAVMSMMTTTSSSISLEGKQITTVKSLPISMKNFLDGKILMNLSIIIPFYVLSEIFMLPAIRPSFLDTIWCIVIPALFIVFAVVLGITVNLKFHNFQWCHKRILT